MNQKEAAKTIAENIEKINELINECIKISTDTGVPFEMVASNPSPPDDWEDSWDDSNH